MGYGGDIYWHNFLNPEEIVKLQGFNISGASVSISANSTSNIISTSIHPTEYAMITGCYIQPDDTVAASLNFVIRVDNVIDRSTQSRRAWAGMARVPADCAVIVHPGQIVQLRVTNTDVNVAITSGIGYVFGFYFRYTKTGPEVTAPPEERRKREFEEEVEREVEEAEMARVRQLPPDVRALSFREQPEVVGPESDIFEPTGVSGVERFLRQIPDFRGRPFRGQQR